MTRRKLPIGLQTFRTLREEGCYYVGKTPFALKLIEEGSHYFLSRPRRFGKSLFLDTLAEVFAGLEAHFQALFASIPQDWHRNNPIARYEGYYASVFYAYFASLGLDLTPEDSSNRGRLDLALRFNRQVYLFEFKVVELEPEGQALQQIKARGYADKYWAEGLPIHLIGVEFSRERRAVVGFEVETLN